MSIIFAIVFDPETCRRVHVESLRPRGSLGSAELVAGST